MKIILWIIVGFALAVYWDPGIFFYGLREFGNYSKKYIESKTYMLYTLYGGDYDGDTKNRTYRFVLLLTMAMGTTVL